MSVHCPKVNFESDAVSKLTMQGFIQYFWRELGFLSHTRKFPAPVGVGSQSESYQVFLIEWPTKQDWISVGGKVLFDMLYILTQLGFVLEESAALEQDTRNHVEQGEYLYLVTQGGLIVTWAIFDYLRQDSDLILYLSGVMVAPRYQGKGISSALIRTALGESKAKYLAARTQNPVMYESILKACGNVFPNPDVATPADVIEVGEFVAKNRLHMSNYDLKSMLSKSVYGACLYGKPPASVNEPLNSWFTSCVNQADGDAMLVVARV